MNPAKKMVMVLMLGLWSLGAAQAQTAYPHEIVLHPGEKWWGGLTVLGEQMPLERDTLIVDLGKENLQSQAAPFLLSSYGRYVWSDRPFRFAFRGTKLIIEEASAPITVRQVGTNLREAFILGADAHFARHGKQPPELFFSHPQYNTWMELQYNQNQDDIERYAEELLREGFPAGVLMVDDGWQRYYGSLGFKAERFPDPVGMVDRLHAKGFKVMLWVSPFVSPDSPEFRDLQARGYLIRQKGREQAAIIPWWNGYSACYDLTNPEAFAYLLLQLKRTQVEYGVDGFKFDAGDLPFYDPTTQQYADTAAQAVDHLQKWAELGSHFPYNEFRAGWKMQQAPIVERLRDKNHSWEALQSLIPEMVNAGLLGYAFTTPDMIGGGQRADLSPDGEAALDQDLVVRSAQLQALMPMMQFSMAPWRVLDSTHLRLCRAAAQLHEKMAPYLLEVAHHAAETGEPMVRHMEYMYPNKGFSNCHDQYMLGSDYLIAPILSPTGKRTVRLPRGTWVDDLGNRYRGPLVLEITAPLDRIPHYHLKR